MKSYTDLPQSKKLAEFLPLESADMCYLHTHSGDKHHYMTSLRSYSECNKLPYIDEYCIPCWSLAALLDVLPSATLDSSSDHYYRLYCMTKYTEWYDNPVDACVAMIEKLHEQNLL